MIAILSLLAKFGPYLLAACGVLWGIFKHEQANTKIAQADAVKADAGKQVAEAKTQAAQTQTSIEQGNASAAQAGADSLKEKVNVQNDVAALPDGGAASELRDQWSKN